MYLSRSTSKPSSLRLAWTLSKLGKSPVLPIMSAHAIGEYTLYPEQAIRNTMKNFFPDVVAETIGGGHGAGVAVECGSDTGVGVDSGSGVGVGAGSGPCAGVQDGSDLGVGVEAGSGSGVGLEVESTRVDLAVEGPGSAALCLIKPLT